MRDDLYGIVTEAAVRRAQFGQRRCHGKVSAVPAARLVIMAEPLSSIADARLTRESPRVIRW